MARKKAKPKRLRLRDISGLLEDVEVSLPVSWAASLRVRAALLHGSDNPNGISKLRFWGKNAESMESVS